MKVRHRKGRIYAVTRRWVVIAQWFEATKRALDGVLRFDLADSPVDVQAGDVVRWTKAGDQVEVTVRRFQ